MHLMIAFASAKLRLLHNGAINLHSFRCAVATLAPWSLAGLVREDFGMVQLRNIALLLNTAAAAVEQALNVRPSRALSRYRPSSQANHFN